MDVVVVSIIKEICSSQFHFNTAAKQFLSTHKLNLYTHWIYLELKNLQEDI